MKGLWSCVCVRGKLLLTLSGLLVNLSVASSKILESMVLVHRLLGNSGASKL